MPTIDELPPATSVSLSDLIAVEQGNDGTPGSGTTRSARIDQLPSESPPVGSVTSVVGATGDVTLADLQTGGVATEASVTAETTRAQGAEAMLQTNINNETLARIANDALKAPLLSPIFTGSPTAPTPPLNSNDTSIPTTAFVTAKTAGLAPTLSPAFTGNPTGPTPPLSDNGPSYATTAYVTSKIASVASGFVTSVVGATGDVTLSQLQAGGVAPVSSVTAETTARTTADTTLQTNITNETNARIAADANLAATLAPLNYSLGATGASTRTVNTKLKDVVSAFDFTGVDPNGVADSTAGFQAMINYLQSIGGGFGIIPAGTYKITGTLAIRASNVVLLGTSEYGTVLSFANAAADCIQVGFQASAVKGVMIRNMSLVGAGKTGGNLISAQNYVNSVFSDLSLRNAFNGISVATLNNCTLSNIEVIHSVSGGLGGIVWTSPANNAQRSDVLTMRDVTVNANGTGATGLYVDGMCQTLRADNCGFIHCKYGMRVRNTAGSNTFFPEFFYCNDVEIDGVDINSVLIECGREMHFVHLDCFNAGGNGADTDCMQILADGAASVTNDLTFTACRFAGARQRGVYCEAKQVEFLGCYTGDNSVQGSGLFPGMALGNNGGTNGAAVGINYVGGRIGQVFGDLGNQTWGVTVAAGCSRINILGVDFAGCVTGAIQDNTGGFGNVEWSGCYNINGAPLANRLSQLPVDPSGTALVEGLIWENATSFTLKVVLNGAIKTVTVT